MALFIPGYGTKYAPTPPAPIDPYSRVSRGAKKGSAYGGLGKPFVAAAASVAGSTSDVRTLQQFLKNRGYAISVDGIRGPQTEAAVAAYHQGIAPRAWNTRSAHAGPKVHTQAVRGTSRVTTPARVSRNVGRAPNRGPIRDPLQAAQAATAGTPLGADQTDEQLAQSMVAGEFDPQIAALREQMASARAGGAQAVANLGRWYGDVGSTAQSIGAQTQASDASLLQGEDTANQNMLQLFGGPGANGPAGEAGAFADINRAAMTQLSAADQSYTKNLVPIIQTQGTEAQAAAQSDTNAQLSELASALAGLQSQRGSAYTKNLSDIRQQNLENSRAQQALDLAKGLMPSQIAEARASASLAQTKARLAPIQARRDAKSFGMSVQRYNAELAQTRARTKAILADLQKTPDGGIDMNDPNTRSSLGDRLRGSVQTKNGTWRMHPGAAQKNLNLALSQLGLQNNPEARSIANNLLAETANNSVSRGMWTQFRWVNGKLVKGPRTALGRRNRAAQAKAAKGQ